MESDKLRLEEDVPVNVDGACWRFLESAKAVFVFFFKMIFFYMLVYH